MLQNSIFRKIYVRSTVCPFYKEEVNYRFGLEGEKTLNKMLEKNIIKKEGEMITSGDLRIEFTPEIVKYLFA